MGLAGKTIVVFGLANKKSVACAIARVLVAAGARVIHVVRSEQRAETASKLFPQSPVFCCDVEAIPAIFLLMRCALGFRIFSKTSLLA